MSSCSGAQYTVDTDTTCIDIEHNAGEPFWMQVPILDDNDDPVAIPSGTETAWLAVAQIRRNFNAPVLHEWTTAGAAPNAVIVPGVAAVVELSADGSVTAAWQTEWTDWTCAWDLWLTVPASGVGDVPDPFRLAKGGFRLWPRITH